MVYLNNTTEAQAVFIPRDVEIASGELLTLTAKSTVGLDTPIDVRLIDLNLHRLYFNLAVTLPDGIAPGEYQYELAAGPRVLSTGLMVIRDNGEAVGQYNKEITYEQYESE